VLGSDRKSHKEPEKSIETDETALDGSGDGEIKEPTPATEEVAAEPADVREGRPRRNRRPPKSLGDYAW
jgi:hypothetical protein